MDVISRKIIERSRWNEVAKIPGKMLSTPIVLKKGVTPMELPHFLNFPIGF